MTDIKVGDLVKATHVKEELTLTGRVSKVEHAGAHLHGGYFTYYASWRFEVLDRPAPPIDEELITGVRRAYSANTTIDMADWKAVINFVREYDQKNATKENA